MKYAKHAWLGTGRCSMALGHADDKSPSSPLRQSRWLLPGVQPRPSTNGHLRSFQPQPVIVQGPPGGEIDPDYAYAGPAANTTCRIDSPSADPQDPDYVMGAVTDARDRRDARGVRLLDRGRRVRSDLASRRHGRGRRFHTLRDLRHWLWTDYGWTFSCDWSWGWLPFHYGYWGWFDDYWAWVPDYTWSPAQVEWRSGGGYVGWRPIGPHTRDHRVGASRGRSEIIAIADRSFAITAVVAPATPTGASSRIAISVVAGASGHRSCTTTPRACA